MKCLYLRCQDNSTCAAGEKPYIPSLFQLKEYCKKWSHRQCPFYLGFGLERRFDAATFSRSGSEVK